MGAKHLVTSFSYPFDKLELVNGIEKQAQKDGKSLSKIIIECLEDYQKKNAVVDVNPTNLKYQDPKIKTLDDYLIDLIKVDEFLSEDKRTPNEITRIKGKILGLSKKAGDMFYEAKKRERQRLLNV